MFQGDQQMTIKDKIIEILSSHRGGDAQEVDKLLANDSSLAPLAFSSIEFIKVIVDFESEFGIDWGEEDMHFGKFESLSDLFNYIERKINEKVKK